ncbi:hypothetical protein JCM16358_09430 [Halanaerocella petrolearia]
MKVDEKLKEKEEIASELNEAFVKIKDNMQESFRHIKSNPQDRDEIINLWKSYIKRLFREFTVMSEKYKERGIIKAITKTLMFGR